MVVAAMQGVDKHIRTFWLQDADSTPEQQLLM